jgi:hypothetical protein
VDGHPQPPSPLVVSLGGPAPPGGVSLFGRGIAGTFLCLLRSLRSSGTNPSRRAHQGPMAMKLIGSPELGRHLVDACLGAVVVLARRPGYADRTDHVVADLNRQTTG